MIAYDTGATRLTATAEVFITVLRNLNGPIFDPQIYRVTIDEDTMVGQYIQKLTVADSDGVSASVCLLDLFIINLLTHYENTSIQIY